MAGDYLDPRKGKPKPPPPSKGAQRGVKPAPPSRGVGQVPKPPTIPGPSQRPPATIPGPVQRAPSPAPVYNAAPYYGPGATIPGPSQTYQNFAPAPSGGGDFGGGGGAGFAAPMAAPAPPPPRQLNEGEWLAGDADFKDQNNEYNRALNEFKRRIGDRKKNFDDDAKLSTGATQKNQTSTLNGLGEDFAARGLSFSGLYDDRKTKTSDSFRNQLANIETVRNRNKAGADEEMADYSSENQLSRGNAKRQALARMAAQQALINAGGAF